MVVASPNRTERLLHWRIELFKVLAGTLVLLVGGLIAVSRGVTWETRFTREGWLMLGGIIGAVLIIGVASWLAWITLLTIRTLPDE